MDDRARHPADIEIGPVEPRGPIGRRTFVLQVRPDGSSTLENAVTGERVRLGDLAAVGPTVERWLADSGSGPAGDSACGQSRARWANCKAPGM